MAQKKGDLIMLNGFRKITAIALALTMLLGLTVTAYADGADPGDLISATIKGKTVAFADGLTPDADTVELKNATKVPFPLTEEEMAETSDVAPVFDWEGDADTDDVQLLKQAAVGAAQDLALSAIFDDPAAEYNGTVALAAGDLIFAVNDEDAVVVFEITLYTPSEDGGYSKKVELEGKNDLEELTIEVVLPTSLDFSLNPLELAGSGNVKGNQIKGADFAIANLTKAPVRVMVEFEASGTAGVEFVKTDAELRQFDWEATNKAIMFGALGATEVEGTPTATMPNAVASATFSYTVGQAETEKIGDTLVVFEPDEAKKDEAEGSIAFALAASADGEALADADKGLASFQFYANLNTYAGWKAEDIEIAGVYTLTAMHLPSFASLSGFAADGLNQLKGAGSVEIGGGGEEAVYTATFAVAVAGTGATTPVASKMEIFGRESGGPTESALTVKFEWLPDVGTISVGTSAGIGSSPWPASGDTGGWTYEAGTGVLTLNRAPGGNDIVIRVGSADFTFNFSTT